MTEDISLDSEKYTSQFLIEPIKRSLDSVRDYSGGDPVAALVWGLYGRAISRGRRDGKQRLTADFIRSFTTDLRRAHSKLS